MAVLFIFIGYMHFVAPTLDNADPPFALALAPDFTLHHIVMADQDPARGSL